MSISIWTIINTMPIIIIGLIGGVIFSYLPINSLSKTKSIFLGLIGAVLVSFLFGASMLLTPESSGQTMKILGAIIGSVGLPLIFNKNPKT